MSSVTPKETKNTQGCWGQQYIWHSEHHSQERRIFLHKPPSKSPLFLVPGRLAWRTFRILSIFYVVSGGGEREESPRRKGGGGAFHLEIGGGGGTRAKWVPFVLLAFFPLFYCIICFKIGRFPFKTCFGSLKKAVTTPQLASLHGLGSKWAKNCYKTGEKTPKGQMLPISRAPRGGSEEGRQGGAHRG